MSEIKMTGVQRVWFLPLGAEPLETDGGQLWYGDKDGLGSASDLSKTFKVGSFKLADDDSNGEPE